MQVRKRKRPLIARMIRCPFYVLRGWNVIVRIGPRINMPAQDILLDYKAEQDYLDVWSIALDTR